MKLLLIFFFFFFFKQKTAYEISVRDWSSDVCSSDLRVIATWPPKPKQTTVLVENLNEVPQTKPSLSGRGRRGGQQAGAPGEGSDLKPPPFLPHQDPAQNVDVPQ